MNDRTHRLVQDLTSTNLNDRISASYKLDEEDFRDAKILQAVRENLKQDDNELKAITLIRLLVRAKDKQSVVRSLDALRKTEDSYVFSSAARGLSNVALAFPEFSSEIRSALIAKVRESKNSEIKQIARDCLGEMR